MKLDLYLSTSAGDSQGCHPELGPGAVSPNQGVMGGGGPDLCGCLEEMVTGELGPGVTGDTGCLATLTVGSCGLRLCCWINLSSKLDEDAFGDTGDDDGEAEEGVTEISSSLELSLLI